MDITAATKAQDVGEIVIKDNAGDDTDIVVLVAGPSHPARLEYEKKQSRAFLQDFNKRGKARLPENPDTLFNQDTERLLALTLGWRNLQMEGVDVPYGVEAARRIYEDRSLNVRDQVLAGIRDREVFTKSSATS